jgi:hypothetical protein
MDVYAGDIALEQTQSPAVVSVAGSLATAESVAGTADVALDATDPGSGVYQAVFTVDGKGVQATTLDENGGRCVSAGTAADGDPAFLYVQPCAGSVSVDVPLNTTGLANGTHKLLVTVTDPAGNSAVALDRTITVANQAPGGGAGAGGEGRPNGTNASQHATLTAAWEGASGERVTGPYGRGHRITGRLTATGTAAPTPIAGAQLQCTATPAYAGARPEQLACPKTDQAGRFTVTIPAGTSSRTIELAYRAHLGEALPVATRTLGLTVRAGVKLGVSPRTTSVGHTIHFAGTLLGGHEPRAGKSLILEARSPGGPWIEFDVVRANGNGHFKDAYTFKFPGPVSYAFRAVCEAEADFPYATGASNLVRVYER